MTAKSVVHSVFVTRIQKEKKHVRCPYVSSFDFVDFCMLLSNFQNIGLISQSFRRSKIICLLKLVFANKVRQSYLISDSIE